MEKVGELGGVNLRVERVGTVFCFNAFNAQKEGGREVTFSSVFCSLPPSLSERSERAFSLVLSFSAVGGAF